jgi:hypothetical protein
MQEAFAAHRRHVARTDPAGQPKWVVLIIDKAEWHRGQPIDEALAESPHLEFYRLPSSSPHLNVYRAVLEAVSSPGDPESPLREPGGLEAVAPSEPVLFPDDEGSDHEPDRRVLLPHCKPESISGFVNQRLTAFRSVPRFETPVWLPRNVQACSFRSGSSQEFRACILDTGDGS